MKFNYELTNKVLEFIKDGKLEEIGIGCSDSQVFRIEKSNKVYFLKIAKKGLLTSEYKKLKWLDGKLKVPKIVLYDISEKTEYLITESVKGNMVCSEYYEKNPDIGLEAISQAFKNIYSVDIKDCPFDVSIDYKLKLIKNNVKNNLVTRESINQEVFKKFKSFDEIFKYLEANKFYDELCFSHGDTSLPNIFAENEKFTGFIDVGECGIADKWFDLAICEKSIKRNYGDKYIPKFYEKLGIIPDRKKIDYYLLIMELYL